MIKPACLKCDYSRLPENPRPKIRRMGFFYRTSDSSRVQRYYCCGCKTTFSAATFSLNYWQRKRRKNRLVVNLLVSGVSQRRAARLASVNRKTVARILIRESGRAEFDFSKANLRARPARLVQFDDLETFEHTKCKPVSVTIAVEEGSRRILGLAVARMPAKGPLTSKAKKLYGFRQDERAQGRRELFKKLRWVVAEDAVLKSDQNPHYPASVRRFFPKGTHVTYQGRRSAITGQGELKRIGFDPIFSLNHTCAMFRANLSRLFRKTWCTTKSIHSLRAHLILYAEYHNRHLPRLEPALNI